MKIYHTLALKITIMVAATVAVLLLGSTIMDITVQQRNLQQAVQISAERASAFAKKALRTGMERNRQDEILRIITLFGTEPGVERIRIYDKMGTIRYSTHGAEMGTVVDRNADACTMCHGSGSEFERTSSDQYVRIYNSPMGYRILGFINPIKNERSCWDADCHAHPRNQTVLGVLDVQMSMKKIDEHIASSTRGLVTSALILLVAVVAVSGAFIYYRVHKPVKAVTEGTRQLSTGNLEHRITVRNKDEIGELAHSFNRMADSLSTAEAQLVDWSNTLEQKVETKTRELQQIQDHILHMEKMASLGKLSSMIAHELNNPLSGILSYAKLDRKRLEGQPLSEDMRQTLLRDLKLIADEATRCGDIVRNLLFFARSNTGSMAPCRLRDIIDKSIRLLQHQISMQDVTVNADIAEPEPTVFADQNQIQQVLVALMMNALEAMHDGGTLGIATSTIGSKARIVISDTGVGIPAQELNRIFEPFYTTKESGFGTGLGLSIVYGIIKNHGGDIAVNSTLGKGSTFTIHLPLRAAASVPPERTTHP